MVYYHSIMKIGIPRAGLYYQFFPLWNTFFKELGFEVVYSPPTNASLLKKGLEYAHSDICFPMKVNFGHVYWLKDKVDVLFVPRFISLEEKKYMCPKFMGLPDMLKASISNLPPLLDVNFNIRKKPFIRSWIEVGKRLRVSANKVKKALVKAEISQKSYQWNNLNGGDGLKIGIVARPYIIYDKYVSAELIDRLKEKGMNILTADNLIPEIINKEIAILKKPIYFDFGEKNVGTALHFLNSGEVDGFLYLISFECGPDSLLKEIIDDRARTSDIPYTTLVLDEHTEIAGILTRVEAFLDMIEYKSKTKFNL